MHRTATLILSGLMLVLGLAMVVTAIAGGGGPLSYGVIIGSLFSAVGGSRLYLTIREPGA